MHVAKGAALAKMTAEGFDPDVLDTGSDPPAPSQDGEPKIAVEDDPRFPKFPKMPQVGVPKVTVEEKLTAEGFDPAVLDMDPSLLVPKAKGHRTIGAVVKGQFRHKRLHW